MRFRKALIYLVSVAVMSGYGINLSAADDDEDEEEIEETFIESTETDQEEIVEEVEVVEEELDMDVPFAIIEDVPLYPGCERVPKSQRRSCFQSSYHLFLQKDNEYLNFCYI